MALQAGTAFVQVVPSLRGFVTTLRREIEREVDDIRVAVGADTDQAREAIAEVRDDLRAVDREDAKVEVDVDTDRATTALAGLGVQAGKTGSSLLGATLSSRLLNARILALAGSTPLLASSLGVVAGAAGGMTSALAAAGSGAVAFGIVAVPAIKQVTDAFDEGAAAIAALPPELQRLAGVITLLEADFATLRQASAEAVSDALIAGIDLARTGMSGLLPIIESAADGIEGFADDARAALRSPFWGEFFGFLASEAGPTIRSFGRSLINVAEGFSGILVAFGPLARDMSRGLEDLTARFADFGRSLRASEQFQEFVAFVRSEGPIMVDTLFEMAEALIKIAAILASGAGRSMLRFADGVAQLGNAVLDVTLAWRGFIEAIENVARKAPGVGGVLGKVLDIVGVSQSDLTDATKETTRDFDSFSRELERNQVRLDTAAFAAQALKGEMDLLKLAVGQADTTVDGFNRALQLTTGPVIALDLATIGYQESLDQLRASLKENGLTMNVHTERGRANRRSVIAVAQAANEQTRAMIQNGASLREVSGRVRQHRRDLINQMVQMGINEDRARRLANRYLMTPDEIKTTFRALMQQALTAILELRAQLAGIPRDIFITAHFTREQIGAGFVPNAPMAAGGLASFRPVGTDTVPAMLTPGEFVQRKSAVDREGVHKMRALNEGRATVVPMQLGGLVAQPPVVVRTASGLTDAQLRSLAGDGGRAGINVEQLIVRAFSDRFNLKQVMDDLALRGLN